MANDKDNISKFIDMTKSFKSKYDDLSKEVLSGVNGNIGSALKNYAEIQETYSKGFVGITSNAQKADSQLLESFDKHYNELKTNISNMHAETKKNANAAIDGSLKQFQTQCEELLKKHPQLPEKSYKEVMQQITANKSQVSADIDKRFREALEKLAKNFAATRKELTIPEMKPPKIPPLDANSKNVVGTSKPAEKK